MNDVDWDAMQKKRIAQGEKHRKKRRRGCTLPTDFMTNKQIEKMHGEVITVNLNEPITWDDYKRLSKDSQELYYNSIVERFNVGQILISRHLFHISQATLSHYQLARELKLKHGTRANKEQEKAFIAFCAPVKEPIAEAPQAAEPTMEEPLKEASGFKFAEFVFEGIELEEIARTLKYFIPKGARITIRAEVR